MLFYPIVILQMIEGEDRDFIEALYARYGRLMHSIAWRYSRASADVEDIVSDSCLQFILHIEKLRSLDGDDLCRYVIATVRNTTINLLRKQRRLASVTSQSPEEILNSVSDPLDLEQKVSFRDETARVLQILHTLPEKEQLVIRMKFLWDLPDAEIAGQVHLSVKSIGQCVSRARKYLKAKLYSESKERIYGSQTSGP